MRKTLILAILVVLPLTFHGCDKNGTTVELPPPVKPDDKDKGEDSGNTGGETVPPHYRALGDVLVFHA